VDDQTKDAGVLGSGKGRVRKPIGKFNKRGFSLEATRKSDKNLLWGWEFICGRTWGETQSYYSIRLLKDRKMNARRLSKVDCWGDGLQGGCRGLVCGAHYWTGGAWLPVAS